MSCQTIQTIQQMFEQLKHIDAYASLELIGNLAHCTGLFIDPVEYGLHINAPVTVAIASDNRLMVHTMTVHGYDKYLYDYAWSRVTNHPVTIITVEGDHITMVDTDMGKKQYAECFDMVIRT